MIERARSLATELSPHRISHATHRRLDPDVADALRADGLVDCLAPRELGAAELAPHDYVAVLEALATGDPAAAWVTMTASTSSVLAVYLPRDTARAMWAERPFLAGVFAPGGKLVGDRLTGRWSYASGCQHADWFVMGALVERDGKPRHVVCAVLARDVQIIDTWNPLGLHGTGSHDVTIDAAVPASHVTSVFERAPWSEAPLYRVPLFGLLAIGIAAVGLGIARGALDGLAGGFRDAPPALLASYAVQRARLDAARAYLVATAQATVATATAGPVDGPSRGQLRLAASHVAHECAAIARAIFHATGGPAVHRDHPAQLSLRDLETVLTHRMVSERIQVAAARAVLGIGTIAPDL
ncbi:MAG: hypothetical protein WKG01_07285 [Kofleriaceae bacterium]